MTLTPYIRSFPGFDLDIERKQTDKQTLLCTDPLTNQHPFSINVSNLAETKEKTFSIQMLEHLKIVYSEGNTKGKKFRRKFRKKCINPYFFIFSNPISQLAQEHTGLIGLRNGLGTYWTSQVALAVKNLLSMQETQEIQIRYLGWEDTLKQEMATHSSILAWKIPEREECDQLQSAGVTMSRTRLSD